jgi:small subunit ribosomal protein S6
MSTYEGMLLVEPTVAAREWEKIVEEVERVAERNKAKVLSITKWGERKLAFPVKKNNRGAYVVSYFEAEGESVKGLRSDFNLSEVILRSSIFVHEGEMATEAPEDFPTAGLIRPKRPGDGDRPGRPPMRRGGF